MARNVKKYKVCPIGNEDDNEDGNEDGNENENEDEDMGAYGIDGESMEMDNKDEDNDIEMDNEDEDENNEMNDRTVKVLLGHSDEKELAKTVCYEDVNLLLLPNSAGTRDLLVLEIDLQYTKGHQRQSKR